MTPVALDRRLSALEAKGTAVPIHHTPEEREAAARQFETLLNEPEDPDPLRDAYFASRTLKEIAADWDECVRTGRYAPWLWGAS